MNGNLIFYHKTVLINETINLLNVKESGVYVDATLGGGGLSQEILNRLGNRGKLISIDVDQYAIDYCKQNNINCIEFKTFKDIINCFLSSNQLFT